MPGKKKGPNLSGPPGCRPKATTAVVGKDYHNILSSTLSAAQYIIFETDV